MKIMALNRIVGSEITAPAALDIIPDSAVIKEGKPFFVPDFSEKWVYEVCPAVRINRLGKNIGEKFAPRYYDALTLCLRLVPVDMIEVMSQQGVQSALATSFDGAVILGDWQDISSLPATLALKVGDLEIEIETAQLQIDKIVKQMSQYLTFKIGDILIPGKFPGATPFAIDNVITGSLNGKECLLFRTK